MDVNRLRSEIVRCGFNQGSFCDKINMSQATFSRRMKTGVFRTDEVMRMAKVLNLEDPSAIFLSEN